jgi:hypothetical protein
MEVKTNRTSLLCGNRNGQHGTKNVKTQNRATLKKRRNTDSTKKNRGWTQVLVKGKQFLLLIRHPLCYSYRQSTPVKVLTVIEERKHLCKKIKDPLLFEIWIFRNGHPDCGDDRIIFVAMTSTNVKVKVRSRLLSISSILNFKLIA